MTPPAPVVTYLRVPTDRKRQSGSRLEAQSTAATPYLASGALMDRVMKVERGQNDNRLQSVAASALCWKCECLVYR